MLTPKEIIARERGKRLRVCRDYSGLNILEFCRKYGFNSITFGRWEKGNKVSLNEKNVDKVCHALLKEGIMCTPAWLLEGVGAAPKEKRGQSLFQGQRQEKNQEEEEPDIEKDLTTFSALLVFSEMEVFQDNNPNAITVVVDSPAMEPLYEVGDYVGGIKLDPDEHDLANKKNCLIKLSGSNRILLRNIQFSGDKIILTAMNPKPSSEPMILDGQSVPEIVAPIVFHRKNDAWIRKKV